MYKKIIIALLISIGILSFQSCTTAILDEGNVNSLPPINTPVKYNPDVKTIMTNNCITCHGGSAPNAGLDLTNYTNVSTSILGNLLNRVNDAQNPMPPSGLMLPIDRQKLQKWLDDGLPEN